MSDDALDAYLNGQPAPAARPEPAMQANDVTLQHAVPSRNIGQVAWDTALAGLQGVGAVGDDLAALATGHHTSGLQDWLDQFKTRELRAQEAQDAIYYARQAEADRNAGVLTKAVHGVGRFLNSPLQNIAHGAGYLLPSAIAAVATDGGSAAGQLGLESGLLAGGGFADEANRKMGEGSAHPYVEALPGALAGAFPFAGKLAGAAGEGADAALAGYASKHPFASKMASNAVRLGADGAAGGGIMATQAALEGEDPATAFGEGIAPGLALGLAHGGASSLKTAVGEGAKGAGKAVTSRLGKVLPGKTEQAAEETTPTEAEAYTPPAEDKPADQPEPEQEAASDQNYSIPKNQKALLDEQLGDGIAQHIEDVVSGNKDLDAELDKAGNKIFTTDNSGKTVLKPDVKIDDVQDYLDKYLSATGNTHLGATLRNQNALNNLYPDTAEAVQKYMQVRTPEQDQAAFQKHADDVDNVAENLTSDQLNSLSAPARAIINHVSTVADDGKFTVPDAEEIDQSRPLFMQEHGVALAPRLQALNEARNYRRGLLDDIANSPLDDLSRRQVRNTVDNPVQVQSANGQTYVRPSIMQMYAGLRHAALNDDHEQAAGAVNAAITRANAARYKVDTISRLRDSKEPVSIKEPHYIQRQGSTLNWAGRKPNTFYNRSLKPSRDGFSDALRQQLLYEAHLEHTNAKGMVDAYRQHFGEDPFEYKGRDYNKDYLKNHFQDDKTLRNYILENLNGERDGTTRPSEPRSEQQVDNTGRVSGDTERSNNREPEGERPIDRVGRDEEQSSGHPERANDEPSERRDSKQTTPQIEKGRSVATIRSGSGALDIIRKAALDGSAIRTNEHENSSRIASELDRYGYEHKGGDLWGLKDGYSKEPVSLDLDQHRASDRKSFEDARDGLKNGEINTIRVRPRYRRVNGKIHDPDNRLRNYLASRSKYQEVRPDIFLRKVVKEPQEDFPKPAGKPAGETAQQTEPELSSGDNKVFHVHNTDIVPDSLKNLISRLHEDGFSFRADEKPSEAVKKALEGMELSKDEPGTGIAVWDGKSMDAFKAAYDSVKAGHPFFIFRQNGAHFEVRSMNDLRTLYDAMEPAMQRQAGSFMHFTEGKSQAEKFVRSLHLGNVHDRPTAIGNLERNIAEPDEARKNIAAQVKESEKVLARVKELTDTISKDLEPVFKSKVQDYIKKFVGNEQVNSKAPARQFLKLANEDLTGFDPHFLHAGVVSILDDIHNHAGFDGSINMSADHMLNRVTDNVVKMMDLERPDNVHVMDVKAPIAAMVSTILKVMATKGDLKLEERPVRDNIKALFYTAAPKDNSYLPTSWLHNMAARNPKTVAPDWQINEPVPPKHPSMASPDQRKALSTANNIRYQPSAHMVKVLKALGSKVGDAFLPDGKGYLQGYEHIRNARYRARQDAADWLANNLSDEADGYYFNAHIADQGRIMYHGSMNPQASKILRHTLTPWSREIEYNGNFEDLPQHWRIAFAQALGQKIERNTAEDNLAYAHNVYNDLVQSGDLQRFQDAYAGRKDGEAIFNLIRSRKLDEHGLAALTELAALHEDKKIASRLAISTDGITNGPATGIAMFEDLYTPEGRENLARAGVGILDGDTSEAELSQQNKSRPDLYVATKDAMKSYDEIMAPVDKDTRDLIKEALKATGAMKDGVWDRSFLKQPIQQASYLSTARGLAYSLRETLAKEATALMDAGEYPGNKADYLSKLQKMDMQFDPNKGELQLGELPKNSPYDHLGRALEDALSENFGHHIRGNMQDINAAMAIEALRCSLNGDKVYGDANPTFGEIKEADKFNRENAPAFMSPVMGTRYLPTETIGGKKTFATALQTGEGAAKAPEYKPTYQNITYLNKRGATNKGGGVTQIQSAGDVHAMTLATKDRLDATQVYDGVYADPEKSASLAQDLNRYWADNLHMNPFTQLIDGVEKFVAEGAQPPEGFFTALGYGRDYTVRDLLRDLKTREKAQNERIRDMAKLNLRIEQFSNGPNSAWYNNKSSIRVENLIDQQPKLTSTRLHQLAASIRGKFGPKENPVGHAVSKLIEHNMPHLEGMRITSLEDNKSLNQLYNDYGYEGKPFDNANVHGVYIPDHDAIIVRKTGDIKKDNKVMLHELTHAMITKNLNREPINSVAFKRLKSAMDEVLAINVPGNKDLEEIKAFAKNSRLSPTDTLNELCARFISSRSIIEAALDRKSKNTRIRAFLNRIGKMVFGDSFDLTPGSVGEVAFKSIASFSGKTADVKPSKSDPLFYENTRQSMWDSSHAEEMKRAQRSSDFMGAVNDAASSLQELKNVGWTFTPEQTRLFLHTRGQIGADKERAASFLRNLAPVASDLMRQHGRDYLGQRGMVKNLLALLSTHPNSFEDIKSPTWWGKENLKDYGTSFGYGAGSWDHTNWLHNAERLGDVARVLDRGVAQAIGKTSDTVVRKLSKGRFGSESYLKGLQEGMAKLSDRADMPEAVRTLYKGFMPVLDSEVPMLAAIREWKTKLDRFRQNARNQIPDALKKQFKGKVTRQQNEALFRAARTDFAAYPSWEKIITGEGRVSSPTMTPAAKKAADALAYHLATGDAVHDLHGNADIITSKFGGDRESIDRYIGEKAYSLLPEDVKITLKALYNSESEGVSSVLQYHQNLQTRNTNTADKTSLYNGTKGYLPNSFKDGTFNLAAVKPDTKEYDNLKKLGYSVIGKDKDGYLIMSGSHSGNITSNQGGLARIKYSYKGYNAESRSNSEFALGRVPAGSRYDVNGPILRPVFNENGKVLHYERQFQLPEKLKYQRMNDVFRSLGSYEGNLAEFSLRDAMNSHQIGKLKEAWNAEKDKSRFVNIATSSDPIIRQAFSSLPNSFHAEARRVFGKTDFVPVQRSLVDDFLGYKKASVGDFWTGDTRWSPQVQKAVQDVAHKILGEKAYQHLMTAENLVKEGIGYTQRLIAVGSIHIPLRNFCTDILQLMSQGIPLSTITTRGVEIAKDIRAYNKARANIYELQVKAATALDKEALSRQVDLENERIQNLRTWPLIKAGVYSVVDDALLHNKYSDGIISPYIQKAMEKLPEGMTTVANNLFATRDSMLFRAVQQGMETGDFIARVLTYEKAIKDGLSHEMAIQKAMNAFVDYGRAKGRWRDCAESLGAAWFWNTKIRSMAIAGQLLRDNPLLSILYTHVPFNTHIGFINNLTTPLTDNIVTQAFDGKLGHSLGWGTLGSTWSLNPFVEMTH